MFTLPLADSALPDAATGRSQMQAVPSVPGRSRSDPVSATSRTGRLIQGVARMTTETHRGLIVDQFTRQAVPFSTASPITDENALRMIIEAARPQPDDTVVDVACGGGIVVCAFAPHVRRAIGIDMTPAMLERAQQLAGERALANVAFDQGDAQALPYPDATF